MSRSGRTTTLLWEALRVRLDDQAGRAPADIAEVLRIQRLRYDTRCAAVTKSGHRCRIKSRRDSDFCPFHDPSVSREHRRQIASRGGRNHHRLARLPDGYLRKLTSRRAAGEAMDRLYREVRLGIITPEMGTVLFNIVTRLLDAGLCDAGPGKNTSSGRSRADRIRPKLSELLTHTERAAWRRAIANAPPPPTREASPDLPARRASRPRTEISEPKVAEAPQKAALQFAS